jgi:hypothetical protein
VALFEDAYSESRHCEGAPHCQCYRRDRLTGLRWPGGAHGRHAVRSIARIWYSCVGLCAVGLLAAVLSRNLPIGSPKDKEQRLIEEDMEDLNSVSHELALTQYSHVHICEAEPVVSQPRRIHSVTGLV